MSPARLPPLVLMVRPPRASAAERWAMAGVWIAILGGLLTTLFLVFGGHFEMDPDALARIFTRLPEKLREDPLNSLGLLAAPLAVVAHLWIARRSAKYQRVFLDATGVRYQSPLPGFLRSLQPDWSLQWSQLRELRIALPPAMANANLAFLEFDAGQVKRKVQALNWVPTDPGAQAAFPEETRARPPFFSFRLSALDREGTLREAERSAIVRYAREAGVKVTTGAMRQSGFSLESNRHTLAATIGGIALLVYGFVDIGLYDESYAVDPPLVLFALGGAVAALAGMLWLSLSGAAPRAETLVLSLFLGGATAVALYPGALRVNAATDSDGLHAYDYRLKAYVVFVPVDSRLPELDFSNYRDYWGQFKLGTTHQFELRKGGLGFYQVNMAPVRARMRKYFRGEK